MYTKEEIDKLNREIVSTNQLLIQEQSKMELLKKQQQDILSEFNISSIEELNKLEEELTLKLEKEVSNAKDYLEKAKIQIEEIKKLT